MSTGPDSTGDRVPGEAVAILAPLVRGLYIAATGRPVFVRPLSGPTRADGAMDGSDAVFVDLSAPGEVAGAAAREGRAQDSAARSPDEAALAGALQAAFARATAGRSDLPAILVARTDAGEIRFGVGLTPGACVPTGADGALPRACMPGAAEDASSAGRRAGVVEGRIACVTGGAQGFGEEIVRGLAASGAFVFIADMNLAGAGRLAESLNARHGRECARSLGVDVTDEGSVRSLFRSIVEIAGGVDLVVSNAGVLRASSVLDQDLASFRFVTDVNYTAFMLVTKYAALAMRAQGRTSGGWSTDIVQINSKSGLQGSNRNGSYAGSKFGSIGLVQSYALELVEFGIKVNAICPGNFFDGPLWSDPERGLFVQYLRAGKVPGATTVADVRAFYEAKVPMGRGCAGPDVLRALYYLVEQEYETGQALPVTGGQVMLN